MSEYWCLSDQGDIEKDIDKLVDRAQNLEGNEPRNLSHLAVESGFVSSTDEYYSLLHEVTLKLARRRIEGSLESSDIDVVNAVRSLETLEEVTNLINERCRDWEDGLGESRSDPKPLVELKEASDDLQDTKDSLREFIEAKMWQVAPNLSELATPLLGARLISLAGGLEDLAKMPSSTVQVLGAEDALFRHLQDGTPPPKHGVIYLHPYVRNTSKENRGSAARAVAGKLTIGARIDYYSGELNEDLGDELEERIQRIRER